MTPQEKRVLNAAIKFWEGHRPYHHIDTPRGSKLGPPWSVEEHIAQWQVNATTDTDKRLSKAVANLMKSRLAAKKKGRR